MPDKLTSPSPSLFQRWFGNGIIDPNIQASWEKMQREYPSRTGSTPRIGEMGPLTRMMNSDTYATTNPLGMINVNTNLINNDKADIDSVLTHELTHVNQVKNNGIIQTLYNNLFNSEQYENEAYTEESNRRNRMLGFRKDVNLPVGK